MERILDFCDVTSCDLSLSGPGLVLRLSQGDVVTKIRIGTDKFAETHPPVKAITNTVSVTPAAPGRQQAVVGLIEKSASVALAGKSKRVPQRRLNEQDVREIRQNWDATVKACGSKNAAADQLGRIYNCSAKNVYAIIYRYSWVNI